MMSIFGELIETPGLREIDAYIAERVKKGSRLRVVRSPHKDIERIWPSTECDLRGPRYAPDTITLSVTQYVYDDKVAIVSSKQENYGLLIESEDFARLQATLFETLGALSIPAEVR